MQNGSYPAESFTVASLGGREGADRPGWQHPWG